MKGVIDTGGGPKLTITDEDPDYPAVTVLLDASGKPLHYEDVVQFSAKHSIRVGDVLRDYQDDDDTAPDLLALVEAYIGTEMETIDERPGSLEMVKSAIARFDNLDGDGDGIYHAVKLWASQLVAHYRAAETAGDVVLMTETTQALRDLGDVLTQKEGDDPGFLDTFDVDALTSFDGAAVLEGVLEELHLMVIRGDDDDEWRGPITRLG